jgi:pimeloyl-ACP methyl ester carboxylesterase
VGAAAVAREDGGARVKVVCLHGLCRTPADWDGVRGALERVAPVMSPAVPGDSRAAVAALGTGLGPGDVVIGHSMGGIVALQLAAAHPLRAVVLTGCFFPFARNGRGWAPALVDYAAHRIAYARAARPGRGAPASGHLPGLARQGLRLLRDGVPPVLATTPVLVVHTRDDHHVPVDFARAALAAHPTWTGAILGHGGHHLHADHPPRWLAAVLPWLEVNVA